MLRNISKIQGLRKILVNLNRPNAVLNTQQKFNFSHGKNEKSNETIKNLM